MIDMWVFCSMNEIMEQVQRAVSSNRQSTWLLISRFRVRFSDGPPYKIKGLAVILLILFLFLLPFCQSFAKNGLLLFLLIVIDLLVWDTLITKSNRIVNIFAVYPWLRTPSTVSVIERNILLWYFVWVQLCWRWTRFQRTETHVFYPKAFYSYSSAIPFMKLW